MNWKDAAAAYAPITEKEIESFSLSQDEKDEVLLLYNRSVMNAKEGGADVAMITLKKLLTRYPNWGEAALLYGICLAVEGDYRAARDTFKQVQQLGFLSPEYTDMAHYCLQEISMDMHRQRRAKKIQENEDRNKGSIAAMFSKKKDATIFGEKNAKSVIPAQTPILTRAPKNAKRVRFASDKERRDVMMQANAISSDLPDEEIELAMPKSPAERLRFFVFAGTGAVAFVILILLIWFLLIPRIFSPKISPEQEKLNYILDVLKKNDADPEILEVLRYYLEKYPEDQLDYEIKDSAMITSESGIEQTDETTTANTSITTQTTTASSSETDGGSDGSTTAVPGTSNTSGTTTTTAAPTSRSVNTGSTTAGNTTTTPTTAGGDNPDPNIGDGGNDNPDNNGEVPPEADNPEPVQEETP